MKESLTPKQVAQAIGVSEASLKRWCDQGLLPATRTAGGHRRLEIRDVVQWLRQSGHPVVQPQVLGFPSNTGLAQTTFERSVGLFADALQAGDLAGSRRIILNLYLGGRPAVDICDQVIAPTFYSIGDGWCEGVIQVYQERRACEICMSILHELASILPPPAEDAPYAIGGTLWDDPYTLPNAMVELALIEAGWRAESHGIGNPASTLAAAIRDRRPDLFWLSASTLHDEESWLTEYAIIARAAEEEHVPVAVGGRALTPERRQRMTYAAYCDTLRHLVGFIQAVKR